MIKFRSQPQPFQWVYTITRHAQQLGGTKRSLGETTPRNLRLVSISTIFAASDAAKAGPFHDFSERYVAQSLIRETCRGRSGARTKLKDIAKQYFEVSKNSIDQPSAAPFVTAHAPIT